MLIMHIIFICCHIKILVAMVTEIVKMLQRLGTYVLRQHLWLVQFGTKYSPIKIFFQQEVRKNINISVNNLTIPFTVCMAFSTIIPGLL